MSYIIRVLLYCSQVITAMAHIPQLIWWGVLGDHKRVEVPVVLVKVLEVMELKEKSKRNLPLLIWYEDFNAI
jgi:hypothetical protein